MTGRNMYEEYCLFICLFLGRQPPPTPQWARTSSFARFLDHTQRRTTVGRTPLDELSARRRDLYLTTHNIHNRHTSPPPVGFEPTISAGPRLRPLDHWVRHEDYCKSIAISLHAWTGSEVSEV